MSSKLRWAPVFIVVISLMFLASYYSITYSTEEWEEAEIVPAEHLPDIFISTEDEVRLCKYDNVSTKYIVESTYEISDIIGMERFQDNILISNKSGLTLLDHDLRRIDGLNMKTPVDIGIDGDIIYCCSNSSLYSISSDLSIMDSIYLNTTDRGGGKNAHDILIHDGSAYLLDNIIFPIFVFKIDISDPWNMEMELGFEIVDINQHLRAQWLDPASGRWFIHQHLGYMGGTDQNILCYSMENGSLLWTQEVFHDSWRSSKYEHGFMIDAITTSDPGWALLRKDPGLHLARFDSNYDSVVFEREMELGSHLTSYGGPHADILLDGDLLFINTYYHLGVVSIEKEPVLVLSQLFDEHITDVIIR